VIFVELVKQVHRE